MGIDAYGSDVNPRMIDYSRQNLEWLARKYTDGDFWYDLQVGDATTIQFENKHSKLISIACEGYLGQPMSQEPTKEKLETIVHDCNVIMRGFLKNIAPQLKPGTRLCVGAPAWFAFHQIRHLPVLDDLESLGYNRIDFEHANREDLIYHREDQIVGRELVVLTKE
jgi:tRNA G10  N-methylase Trm11